MSRCNKRIDPKQTNLMSGVFNYYRKKSLPSDFVKKGYLTASSSSGNINPVLYLGTGSTNAAGMFATNSAVGQWAEIKMKYPVYITHYSLYQCDHTYDNRFRKWQFAGRNEGSSWSLLDDYSTKENTTMQRTSVAYLYTVQKPGKYQYIKLIVYRTARVTGSKYHLVFSGFDIFGTIDIKPCLATTRRSLHNIVYLLFIFVCST